MAAFAFEVHFADAPGEAEADEAAVVAPAVVFGVVGVGGDGVRVGGLEEVVDFEVEREVAVEEVGADAEVDIEEWLAATEELDLMAYKLTVDKYVHLAPQFGTCVEAHSIGQHFVLNPFAWAHLHTIPALDSTGI